MRNSYSARSLCLFTKSHRAPLSGNPRIVGGTAVALLLSSLGLSAAGCCGSNTAPSWSLPDSLDVDGSSAEQDLQEWITDDDGKLTFEAEATDENLIAWTEDDTLLIEVQPDFEGTSSVALQATDRCDNVSEAELVVITGESSGEDDGGTSGDEYFIDPCAVTFTYEEEGNPDEVYVAGTFNEWSTSEHPLEEGEDGIWSIAIPKEEIPAGDYAYKFVEVEGSSESWICDPNAGLIQCDEGYKSADDTTWTHSCGLNEDSCNSMLVVPDYDTPRLTVQALDIDRSAGTLEAEITFSPGCSGAEADEATATLDDENLSGVWNDDTFSVSLADLETGRHTLRFQVTDTAGATTEETYIPFWIDEDGWEKGFMYYAFVDRFVNGDESIDASEGASAELGDYMGGDFQGVVNALDYLEDMGVSIIWISNPQDNAEDAWDGRCDWTYAAYHGYWPDEPLAVEEHFGGEDALHHLVDEAHARGMRVVMDWVCNHVHENHPYYQEHADEWFNDKVLCEVDGDYSNYDDIPEVCWFSDYLPDIDFYRTDTLDQMVEDAIWWVKTYELDGFRVDGAKHVPHSLIWNATTRIDQEVEHGYAGGDEEFYTVGETFTSNYDWISAYVNEDELDAQFDFPLYYSIRSAFVDDSATLWDLQSSLEYSNEVYGDALMSTFLGNHDVSRFVSYADTGSWADDPESSCYIADVVDDSWWYDRLGLAFTWLLTHPGIPLLYYGDEIGMPGYADPDNRHPLWWYSYTLNESAPGAFDLVDYADGMYHEQMEPVLWVISALGPARQEHPAFYSGGEDISLSGGSDDLLGYARVSGDDEMITWINRAYEDQYVEIVLGDAGLSTGGTWEDVLTGDTFSADSSGVVELTVYGNSARVLVLQ